VLAAPPTLADGRVGLSYFVLPDRLLAWMASSSGLRMTTVPLSARRLERQVDSIETLARTGDASAGWRSASARMFDLLVRPFAREVSRAREIVVVPDGPLERLPYAALRDSAGTGHYLIERAAIVQKTAFRSRRDTARAPGSALIVGEPALDARTFPGLASLPGARAEVDIARNALGKAVVLVDSAATKRAVTRALPNATTFHFAGHAELIERAPMLSHLVLATDGSGTLAANVLSAGEIAEMDLRRLHLVVLSSCGTLQARSHESSAQSGLSAAFLAAGADAVVSSRWEIDDGGTEKLMSGFYRALAAGGSPAIALQRAQMQLMQDAAVRRPLAVWSAFRYEEQ
jgi:CHAT domain-containing protein